MRQCGEGVSSAKRSKRGASPFWRCSFWPGAGCGCVEGKISESSDFEGSSAAEESDDSVSASSDSSARSRDEAEWLERAPKPDILCSSGLGNRDVSPVQWAMTIKQWHEFIGACKQTELWDTAVGLKGYANLYDLNKYFIRPWTQGTGKSVALHFNPHTPQTADLMLSHSWAEDIDECAEALNAAADRLPPETRIWFCAFSVYQPGDDPGDVGPNLREQLALDPFGAVIGHLRYIQEHPAGTEAPAAPDLPLPRAATTTMHQGMVVIHTTRAEVYDRLWCVYEIAVALRQDVPISVACSKNYFEASQGRMLEVLKVKTKQAQCKSEEDRSMIVKRVKTSGGFRKLDSEIFHFRMEMLINLAKKSGEIQAFRDEFHKAEKVLQNIRTKGRVKSCLRMFVPLAMVLILTGVALLIYYLTAWRPSHNHKASHYGVPEAPDPSIGGVPSPSGTTVPTTTAPTTTPPHSGASAHASPHAAPYHHHYHPPSHHAYHPYHPPGPPPTTAVVTTPAPDSDGASSSSTSLPPCDDDFFALLRLQQGDDDDDDGVIRCVPVQRDDPGSEASPSHDAGRSKVGLISAGVVVAAGASVLAAVKLLCPFCDRGNREIEDRMNMVKRMMTEADMSQAA